jgi:hypothetical protein
MTNLVQRQRHVAVQHVLGQHASEIDGILRRAELRGITQLGFGEIVYGAAKLNRSRDDVDALLYAFQFRASHGRASGPDRATDGRSSNRHLRVILRRG